MRRGSITIFLALTLTLVLSFVFSLLEGARIACIRSRAEMMSEICMQSMFGNYHAGMWENYHLLFFDLGWQEKDFSPERFAGEAEETLERNLFQKSGQSVSRTSHLLALNVSEVVLQQYQLATDEDGMVFVRQAVQQMKYEAAEDAVEDIRSLVSDSGKTETQSTQNSADWESAWDAMDEAKRIKEEQADSGGADGGSDSATDGGSNSTTDGGNDSTASDGETDSANADEEITGINPEDTVTEEIAEEAERMENPMDYVKEIKTTAFLAQVVSDPTALSEKSLSDEDCLMERSHEEGTWAEEEESDGNTASITERVLLQYYIQSFFDHYVTKENADGSVSEQEGQGDDEEKVLDYEVEYLVGGKKTDQENLEAVTGRLLLIREAMNFITILKDQEKRSLALGIATVAVGFTGVSLLVRAVQVGILLAWSYVESVLDVRALLDGEKVPFLKRTDQWSSDWKNIRMNDDGKAENDEESGLTYMQYLHILMALTPVRTLASRCMDLMERNENVKMDHMMQAAKVKVVYRIDPLFWSVNFVRAPKLGTLANSHVVTMNYCN